MSSYLANGRTWDNAEAITTSATASNAYSAIYIGGAGNLTVVTEAGTTVTFTAPPVGTIIPIRTSKVLATTTATLLVGFK
jgi:hypothetical protein